MDRSLDISQIIYNFALIYALINSAVAQYRLGVMISSRHRG